MARRAFLARAAAAAMRALLALLVAGAGPAQARRDKHLHARNEVKPGAAVEEPCVRLHAGDVLDPALRARALVDPAAHGFASVRLSGLTTLREEQVWPLVGGRPEGALDIAAARELVARLAGTGLFAAISPEAAAAGPGTAADAAQAARVAGAGAGPATDGALTLTVRENESVRGLRIDGLRETEPADLLEKLFVAPTAHEIEASRADLAAPPRRLWRFGRRCPRGRDCEDEEAEDLEVACPVGLPDRSLLARVEAGKLVPGLVWRGLPAALGRGQRWLADEGYPLATLPATLSAQGELIVAADEGRLDALEIRGVSPALADRVRSEVGLKPGDVFSTGALQDGLARIAVRVPFLERDTRYRQSLPEPELQIDSAPDGTVSYRFTAPVPPEEQPRSSRSGWRAFARAMRTAEHWDGPWDSDWDRDVDWSWNDDHLRVRDGARRGPFHRARDLPALASSAIEVRGRTVLVHLRTRHADLSNAGAELIRHTPATGFAPGLAVTGWIFDPSDRVHLALDGAVNINTKRSSVTAAPGSDFLARLGAQERVDWLLGLRLQIPGLRIAELGGQLYTRTDTEDRWRLDALDSYLYSALINRPDAEYFRRSGAAAFVTAHLFDQLTLGAEYRFDRYGALAPPGKVWTLFNQNEAALAPAPVSEGEVGAMIFRLEFSTEPEPLHKVGSAQRYSGVALSHGDPDALFRSVNFLEVGTPALGGDARFKYAHAVTDDVLTLQTGRDTQLRLRVRAGGGHDLPLEKEEALGGWNALRGYGFKEFRGDTSVLGNAELRGRHFGAFLDVGTVHQEAGWLDPRLGAGAQFFLGDHAQLAAAWRLDGDARLAPELRLFFAWPL